GGVSAPVTALFRASSSVFLLSEICFPNSPKVSPPDPTSVTTTETARVDTPLHDERKSSHLSISFWLRGIAGNQLDVTSLTSFPIFFSQKNQRLVTRRHEARAIPMSVCGALFVSAWRYGFATSSRCRSIWPLILSAYRFRASR